GASGPGPSSSNAVSAYTGAFVPTDAPRQERPFQRARLLMAVLLKLLKSPPTKRAGPAPVPGSYTVMARIDPFVPVPDADQATPFQVASELTVWPPADWKKPPTNSSAPKPSSYAAIARTVPLVP